MAIDRPCPWCGAYVRDRMGNWLRDRCPSCGKRFHPGPEEPVEPVKPASSSRDLRHRWGLNLWVTDAEEAKIRVYFVGRLESLAEAARRLLLAEVKGDIMEKSLGREITESLRDYQQVKNVLNEDTCRIGENTPVANALLEFLREPQVAKAWSEFRHKVPRL